MSRREFNPWSEFRTEVDLPALRRVPVQLVIGENDTSTSELAPDSPDPAGADRTERIDALRGNWHEHGVDARLDRVPNVAHDHPAVLPAVQRFLAVQLSTGRTTRG